MSKNLSAEGNWSFIKIKWCLLNKYIFHLVSSHLNWYELIKKFSYLSFSVRHFLVAYLGRPGISRWSPMKVLTRTNPAQLLRSARICPLLRTRAVTYNSLINPYLQWKSLFPRQDYKIAPTIVGWDYCKDHCHILG